jgi:hypothetical protein
MSEQTTLDQSRPLSTRFGISRGTALQRCGTESISALFHGNPANTAVRPEEIREKLSGGKMRGLKI